MISNVLRVVVCSSSFVYTFYTLCTFTGFLSKPIDIPENDELKNGDGVILKTLWILLMNTSLISAFILQHSVMASDLIKNVYYKFEIEDIERSIYNASSSAILYLVISYWQPVPWVSIWKFDTSEESYSWIVVNVSHILAWSLVYCGCCMMDLAELSGLKQVYYKLSGRPRPLTMKSRDLQRYLMHMRHPSFLGFLVILWVYPLMSLDRLLLASILTIYMILMWTIDEDDYNYHSIIIARKERELANKSYY